MKLTRRDFVRTSAIGTAGILVFKKSLRNALAFNQTPGNKIPLFANTLRGVGPGGIPVALADRAKAKITGVTHYTIDIREFTDQVLPASADIGRTTLWGYVPTVGLQGYTTPTHLGGILIGQKGIPIQITFRNRLPNRHILPVDITQVYSNEGLVNRTAVHLHGGLVPWISDGGPFDWWAPNGTHGMSFLNNDVLNPSAKDSFPGYAEYYYPLNQSARFMWYHDHAHGITRLNAYAGLASGMLIRDSHEAGLMDKGLPGYIEAGGKEIPLIFQDKIFVVDPTTDPGYQGLTATGSLWYAHTYEANQPDGTGRWDLTPGGGPLPEPSVVAEFFGDTMLVNGTTCPEVTVEARRYRFRLLNACNARFLNLQLYVANNTSPEGITLDASGVPVNAPFVNAATGDSSFLQIGAEGGFLSAPASIPCNVPLSFVVPPDPITGQTDPSPTNFFKSLVVAPAERPDIILDFSNYVPGDKIILYSDAPAPFPSGDDRNDYFPGWNVGTGLFGVGNPVNGTTTPGFAPNTRVLMRFNVVAAQEPFDEPLSITGADLITGIDPKLIDWGLTTPPPGVQTRRLTLNEYADDRGRLIQIIGNSVNPGGNPYAADDTYLGYLGAITPTTIGASPETVNAGDTEVWEVFNTTGDVHPMHFHLVNVQVINRQLFDVANLAFDTFTGPIIPPEPNELGWKETVPMYPGTVTRVIMKFDTSQAKIVAANGRVIPTPSSPRTGGLEYVWHCHILEHEEHDMMHALVVMP
jgi:spore coat protein A, manganese oxidase